MSMFSIFGVSGSAVSAQSQRLNVVASNLANADAVAGPDGQGYKARQVVFQTVPMGSDASAGVKVNAITESNEPLKRVHNPTHPLADAQCIEVAVDDVGQHRDAFVQPHVGDRIRHRPDAPAHAEAVDDAMPAGGAPVGRIAQAQWADRARIPVRLAAVAAMAQHHPAFVQSVPERASIGSGDRKGFFHAAPSRIRTTCSLMMPPLPVTKARLQSRTWLVPARCMIWRVASITWCMPPAIPVWPNDN